MNRDALLIYLRDLRDLEIARRKIRAVYNQEKRENEVELTRLTVPNYVAEPQERKAAWGVTIFFLIAGLLCIGKVISRMPYGWGFLEKFLLVIGILGAFFGICGILSEVMNEKKYDKAVETAQMYNKKELQRVEQNESAANQLQQHWNRRVDYLREEDNKVNLLLKKNYNLNILASQYRNLASVYYIYDYMSTSQEDLRDTLIHEHMENGIQRILEKLDVIISQQQEIIFHTRILEADNQRIIRQNSNMLNSLKQIEENSIVAAQYAEISANYSQANAYFSLATYLKR